MKERGGTKEKGKKGGKGKAQERKEGEEDGEETGEIKIWLPWRNPGFATEQRPAFLDMSSLVVTLL